MKAATNMPKTILARFSAKVHFGNNIAAGNRKINHCNCRACKRL